MSESSSTPGTTGNSDESRRLEAEKSRLEYEAAWRLPQPAQPSHDGQGPELIDWTAKASAMEAERARIEAEEREKDELRRPPHDHAWLIPVGPGHDPTDTLKSIKPGELVVLANDSGSDMSMHATDMVMVVDVPGGGGTGCAHALNAGLSACVGDWGRTWVYRMDSDDKAWPGHDRDKVADLSHEEDMAWCGEMVRCDGLRMPMRPTDWMDIRSLLDLRRNPIFHPATIIRRTALLEVGGWPELFGRAEDYAMWIRLVRLGRVNPWRST
jgi:hypothetical protein